jgi:hypothetical protein
MRLWEISSENLSTKNYLQAIINSGEKLQFLPGATAYKDKPLLMAQYVSDDVVANGLTKAIEDNDKEIIRLYKGIINNKQWKIVPTESLKSGDLSQEDRKIIRGMMEWVAKGVKDSTGDQKKAYVLLLMAVYARTGGNNPVTGGPSIGPNMEKIWEIGKNSRKGLDVESVAAILEAGSEIITPSSKKQKRNMVGVVVKSLLRGTVGTMDMLAKICLLYLLLGSPTNLPEAIESAGQISNELGAIIENYSGKLSELFSKVDGLIK